MGRRFAVAELEEVSPCGLKDLSSISSPSFNGFGEGLSEKTLAVLRAFVDCK
jgi:hypothetical protein